jgi:hypothetical protein
MRKTGAGRVRVRTFLPRLFSKKTGATVWITTVLVYTILRAEKQSAGCKVLCYNPSYTAQVEPNKRANL